MPVLQSLKTLLLESNSTLGDLPAEVRKEHIKALNEQWMQEEDPAAPFIQRYLQNPAAAFLKKQLNLHPEEYGEIFLTNRFGALVATTGKPHHPGPRSQILVAKQLQPGAGGKSSSTTGALMTVSVAAFLESWFRLGKMARLSVF